MYPLLHLHKLSVGSSMQIIMCKFDVEIKSYKGGKTI